MREWEEFPVTGPTMVPEFLPSSRRHFPPTCIAASSRARFFRNMSRDLVHSRLLAQQDLAFEPSHRNSSQLRKSPLQHLSGGIHVVTLFRRFRVRASASGRRERRNALPANRSKARCQYRRRHLFRERRSDDHQRGHDAAKQYARRITGRRLDAADRPGRDLTQPAGSHAHYEDRARYPAGSSFHRRSDRRSPLLDSASR